MKRLHALGKELSLEMRGVRSCGLGRRDEEEAMWMCVQNDIGEEEFEKKMKVLVGFCCMEER